MSENDDPKARGKHHFRNKKKMGRPSKIGEPKVPSSKSRSATHLESNWDRYEKEGEEEEATALNSSTDFALLAGAPISKGTHFQFKSDKDIFQEVDIKPPDFFNLNLELLGRSVLTVPFNVRSGIDDKYFSEQHLNIMKASAVKNKEKYEEYLEDNGINDKTSSVFNTHRESNSGSLQSIQEHAIGANDKLEEGYQLAEMKALNPRLEDPNKKGTKLLESEHSKQGENSELLDWLDDVLDD